MLLYILAVTLLGSNILLSIEAVFSYATLGSYAIGFHMVAANRNPPLLSEIKAIAGTVILTVWSGAIAALVAYAGFNGLEGHTLVCFKRGDILASIGCVWKCVYFATTTLVTVGYGDIVPANSYGQIVAFMIELQSFAVLALVVASLFNAHRESKPEDKDQV